MMNLLKECLFGTFIDLQRLNEDGMVDIHIERQPYATCSSVTKDSDHEQTPEIVQDNSEHGHEWSLVNIIPDFKTELVDCSLNLKAIKQLTCSADV